MISVAEDWPAFLSMPDYEQAKPIVDKRLSVLRQWFAARCSSASAYCLFADVLQYNPDRRPSALKCCEYAWFTSDIPPASEKFVVILQNM